MDKEEYNEQLRDIRRSSYREEQKLAVRYATENSVKKIGDIATDNTGSVLVDKIGVFVGSVRGHTPSCIYYGPKITKLGKPFKSGERGAVYQINLVN